MPINVDDARTVFRRPAARMEAPKPLAEYQATIIARFGHLPSWDKLAKIENDARDRKEHSYQPQTALVGHLDRRRAKTAEIMDALVASVTHPMTSQEISTATKTPYATVGWMMARAYENGRVEREKVHGLNIWKPVQEEAEDDPEELEPVKGISPEPIKIIVRGMEFESLRSCAKHFGISVQAVHDAVRRGKADMIGSRKRK